MPYVPHVPYAPCATRVVGVSVINVLTRIKATAASRIACIQLIACSCCIPRLPPLHHGSLKNSILGTLNVPPGTTRMSSWLACPCVPSTQSLAALPAVLRPSVPTALARSKRQRRTRAAKTALQGSQHQRCAHVSASKHRRAVLREGARGKSRAHSHSKDSSCSLTSGPLCVTPAD